MKELPKNSDLNSMPRGNIKVDQQFQTSKDKVFAAGDAAIGASLVVRAIFQGRNLARSVDKYFTEIKTIFVGQLQPACHSLPCS